MRLSHFPRTLRSTHIATALVFFAAAFSMQPCFAGRPLSVDDANVNEVGSGHVEMWYARQPSNTNVWTVAPAYGVAPGIELGVAVARDATNDTSTNTIQAKFRFTPSKKDGCNVGASVGASQTNNGVENTPFVNGLMSCNADYGSVHFNVGANSPPSGPSLATWGVAVEREWGAFTGHTEFFGQEQGSPTFQLGVRTEVFKNILLDGTAGRVNGETVLSVGIKIQF